MENGNDHGRKRRILILGGTGEARALATSLVAMGHDVTTSLAGRTRAPLLPPGAVRIGGFGGIDGLAAYLAKTRPHLLVDATHPFAATISANAVAASGVAGTPLLRLVRQPWSRPGGAVWLKAATMADAASSLPRGARVLLTIGRQEVEAFFPRTDCWFLARMIEHSPAIPADWTVLTAQGPFDQQGEKHLLVEHGITHLVSKNAGGPQTYAKIAAAAELGVPVLMVSRPGLAQARTVRTVAQALSVIADLCRNG